MNSRCPLPRATIDSVSAVREQHRRAQVDGQRAVDLLGENEFSRPLPGQPGVGDEHVDLARLGEQPRRRVGLGEVGDDRAPAELGRQRLEHVGAPPGQRQHARRARASAARDRLPEPAGRAGQQDPRAVELHANTATVAVKLCRK